MSDLPPGTLTVDIPLSEEERKALETLAKAGDKGPNEIVIDAVKRRLACEKHATAFKEKTVNTVDVTLKLPKSFVEFMQAARTFSRTESTVEEICARELTRMIVELLQNQHLDEVLLEFDPKRLSATYALDQIDC